MTEKEHTIIINTVEMDDEEVVSMMNAIEHSQGPLIRKIFLE